jgi:hypothetical protein
MEHPQRVPRRGGPVAVTAIIALVIAAAILGAIATIRPQKSGTEAPATALPPVFITEIPQDTGAPGAKVTVEVFLQRKSPCDCDAETALLGRVIGNLDPKRIRVKYRDVSQPEDRSRLREVNQLKCLAGVAVNGKHTFTVPDRTAGAANKTKTVDLMLQRSWMLADMGAILDQELRAVYQGKGLGVAPAAFERDMSAAMAALRDTGRAAGQITPAAE